MPASNEPGRVPPVRILVIDDNRDAADSLALLLKIWGFDVRAVYNGGDAIPAARAFQPDCVLSDIELPDVDGYQVAELFRKDEQLRNVPLIAVSGTYDPERGKAAGYDHDLTKPADPTLLLHLLTRLLLMDKRLERADQLIQQQGEVVGEARDLIKEVKSDMKEIKEELRDVKHDVQEIKEKLRDDDHNSGDDASGKPV